MLTCWLFAHHASLFNFSNGNDLELNVDHNRGTYEEDYTKFIRHATATNSSMHSEHEGRMNISGARRVDILYASALTPIALVKEKISNLS